MRTERDQLRAAQGWRDQSDRDLVAGRYGPSLQANITAVQIELDVMRARLARHFPESEEDQNA